MEQLFLLILLLIVVLFVKFKHTFKASKKSTANDTDAINVFYLKQTLLTPAERSFYGVLVKAVEGRALVFSKVRMIDVISSGSQAAQNKVIRKHLDFVLCDPDTLEYLSVVELDDGSHNSIQAMQRDALKDEICDSVGLKIHRIQASNAYNIQEIRETIFPESILTDKERELLGLNADRKQP